MEKTRFFCQILLQRSFGVRHYLEWTSQVAIQSQWQSRFYNIAPIAMADQMDEFFVGPVFRPFLELRIEGLAKFVPNDTLSIPAFNFSYWYIFSLYNS